MKLDENYELEGDKYNWVLKYESDLQINKKTGEQYRAVDHWHFPNVRQALEKYMNEAIKPSRTVEDLLVALQEISKQIENLNKQKL